MNLINEINDDQKIDYFAALTRSFLYTGMDEVLYLKLAKFLTLCTPGGEFLERCLLQAESRKFHDGIFGVSVRLAND